MKQIVDIAFYSEQKSSSIDEVLQKHRGTWEHFCLLPPTVTVYLIKFANFTDRRQIGNVIVLVQPMPALFLLPPFLNTLLSKVAPSLIITHSLKYPLQNYLLGLFAPKDCKLVLQMHADVVNSNIFKRFVKKCGYKKTDHVLVAGKDLATSFIAAKVLPKSIKVVEMMEGSCDFVIAPNFEEKQRIGLLWVGRLNAGKDLDTLLNACKLLKEKGQQFVLTIISAGGPLQEKVNNTIDMFQLRNNIRFVSNVKHTEMQKYYWHATLFVSTSLHEGSGWSLCEAMACGLPTVVSDIPSHRWMTNQGASGALFNCGDAAQLANNILQCESKRQELGNIARKLFEERLSFQSIATTVLHLL